MADKLFPVFEVPEIDTTTQDKHRKYYPSVFFDYDTGDFRLDGAHRMTEAAGQEAYMQWCRKVVMTERDACLAYSTDIGIEGEYALSLGDHDAVEAALEKTITEALMVNIHTEYVRDFEFTWSADEIRVTFTVKGRSWEEVQLSTSIPT